MPVFLYFFQIKLTGKIGWVSLNNVSKELFEFDSNMFPYFKDHFFKVLATDVMADGLQLMFNRDGEPCSSSTSSQTLPGSSHLTRIY